jgi:type I restriction enzyme, S subunit
MSEWKTYKLGEICTDISYGYTESASSEIVGPKFLRITDIQHDFINWNYVPYCPITESNHKKYKLEVGDIVIARTGASTGATAIFKDADIDAVYASYLIRYKIDKTKADPFYIGHLLKSPLWKQHVNSIIGGSGQPGANAKQFASFKIEIPDLPTQHQIAQILSSLDDKIELNLQMNQTLEAMAQAIFKEWFVNFNFPKCLNQDSLDLLDKQDLEKENQKEKNQGNQDNPKNHSSDNLPKGWRKGKLGDIIDVKGGTTPSTSVDEYWNGDNYWTTPKDLSNAQSPVLIDTERKITDLGVKQISSGVLPKGTLLLSSRAPIGYLAISQVPISINQGYVAIQGKAVSNLFMLFWLKENMEAVKSKANGSTFQEISKSNFKLIDISIPSVEVLQAFDEIIDAIFKKIVENVYSNLSLTQTRDTLLPKLMSGQLKVSEL